MGFIEDVEKEDSRVGIRCSIAKIGEEDPQLAVELNEAMTREEFTTAAITRQLGERGYRLARETVGRHRRGECKCPSSRT